MEVRKDISEIKLTIRKITEIAKAKNNCIRFDIGQPDFDTPQHIKDATNKALMDGKTGYGPVRGVDELRIAIAEYESQKDGLDFDESNIIVTTGGMHALFSVCLAFLEKGDEVIIPDPYWAAYNLIIKSVGGVPVPVHYVDDSKLLIEELERAITSKTKFIFVNSPSNPTGEILIDEDLKKIEDLAEEKDIIIISDEVYERMLFGEHKFSSIAKYAPKRTLRINSTSKTYAMTGWRIGWLTGDKDLIIQIAKCIRATIACVTNFIQYGAVAALNGPQDEAMNMKKEYEKRYVAFKERVDKIGWTYLTPKGTFYMFVDTKEDSWPFCLKMIEEIGVSSVPGAAFGDFGKTYARFCYGSVSVDKINEAFDRIEKWLKK